MILIIPLVVGALGAAVGAVAGAFAAHAAGEKDRQAAKHHRTVANELADKYASIEKKYYELADESKKQIHDLTRQHTLDEVEKDCLRLAVRLQQNLIFLMWEIDREPTAAALNIFKAAVEQTNKVLCQLQEELITVPSDYYKRNLNAAVQFEKSLNQEEETLEIYETLKRLLAAGKWREANEETRKVMLNVAGRSKGDFKLEDIEKFPCQDLYNIDKLWVTYSNGRFGFSVQKNIWQKVDEDWHEFGTVVKWGKHNEWQIFQWISKDELTFSLDAPLGHLPAVFPCVTQSRGFSAQVVWSVLSKFEQEQEEALGIYETLKRLLAAGKWREANEETRKVMLNIVGRSQQGYFLVEDIEKFLCRDLYIINKLWMTYSNSRFGFSVQKDIWQKVREDWHEFGTLVGWKKRQEWEMLQWISKDELTFSLNAPLGHLPAVFPCLTQSRGFSAQVIWSFLSRLDLMANFIRVI